MAKANRGGLGRGLNSLLGGASDGISTPKTSNPRTQDRERIVYDEREDVVYENTDPGVTGRMMPVTPENVSRETIEEVEITEVSEKVVEEPIEENVSRETLQGGEGILEIDIERIINNPEQPRRIFDPKDLQELADSIKREGLIQPILVREVEDGYQIIAGERRWQAAQLAGLKTIPAQVKNVEDEKALELALIENIQRSDLNPIEEAYGYRHLMERNKMTQADIAQAMSKGRSTIANALRLLELPEDAQKMLFEDEITAGHARAILSIPTKEGREVVTAKLKDHPLSVRETEAYARLLANRIDRGTKKKEPQPAIYKSVAKTLKDVLQTNVKIRSSRGKNKIEIEFQDEADLERLFEEIVNNEDD